MNVFKKILISFIIIIGIYSIFLIFSDISTFYDKLSNFKFEMLPVIISLITFTWLILFLRWHLLLKNSNIEIPLKQNFMIFLSGAAFTFTGELGDFVKSQLLKQKFDIPRSKTAPIIVSEWLYTGIGLVSLSLLGIIYFEISAYLGLFFTSLLIFLFIIINSKKLFTKVLTFASKRKFLSNILSDTDESFDIIKNSTRGKIVVLCSILSILFWTVESISVYFILYAFDVTTIEIFDLISMYSSSILLGVASFIPLGIGVVEGSLSGFFYLFGIDFSLGLAIVVIIRIFTRWYGIATGLFILKYYNGFKKTFDLT